MAGLPGCWSSSNPCGALSCRANNSSLRQYPRRLERATTKLTFGSFYAKGRTDCPPPCTYIRS